MQRAPIEFEVREPTGLSLGTYDLFQIREKIYTGTLPSRCEYLDGETWKALVDHPAFSEVLWLVHEREKKTAAAAPKPRIAGWQPVGAAPQRRGEAVPPASTGLLSRFFGKK
jgi:hypothetical protein